MPIFQGDELHLTRDQIITQMIANMQSAIPDVWIGEDGNLRILFEIEAGQIEGVFLANQITLQDMFIQTASFRALQRYGDDFGLQVGAGTLATGALLFSGQGGTYVPLGTEVAFDPGGGGEILYYFTLQDGTVPQPGIPIAPTAVDAIGIPGWGTVPSWRVK